ncbi:MAG: aspartate:alanine exchanger family transporter, partial [Opitutales bacterium]
IVGSGLLLGRISVKGIELGTSMVLFTALLAGHLTHAWGIELSLAMAGNVGLVLFVYCVGVGAGGRFFRALAREGSSLAKLSLLVTILAALLTWLFAAVLDLPVDLATGIFAGALTSTPALAGADEALRESLGTASDLVIGYGIAYPFGVIGVVLFVQLLPRLLRWRLNEDNGAVPSETRIGNALVEVVNPNVFGQTIVSSNVSQRHHCQVSRVVRGGKLSPVSPADQFCEGQRVLLVGEEDELEDVIELLGHRVEGDYTYDTDRERRRLLVTNREFAGKSIRELNLTGRYGVTVTRISRLGITFVPQATTVVEKHDILTTVGMEENLRQFAETIGHRETQIDVTDLLSLSVGIALGVLLGMIPFALPGSPAITLGMAGGPLIAGLLLGHFGKVGGIVGYIPRPTRSLLQELGLVLFLADAGVKGGARLVETVSTHGVMVFVMGIAITLLPMLAALPLARVWLKLSPLQALGGICGGMTSTPALGAITAKTESQIPIISYATAYPVALVIMTLLAKLLVKLMT